MYINIFPLKFSLLLDLVINEKRVYMVRNFGKNYISNEM